MRGLIHEALLFTDEDAMLPQAAAFLGSAVHDGEPAIAVLDGDRSHRLREALGDDADSVTFLDTDPIYRRPGTAFAAYRAKLTEIVGAGATYARIVGEIPLARFAGNTALWGRYESAFTNAFAGWPAHVVCIYDASNLPEAAIDAARQSHPIARTTDSPANGGDPSASLRLLRREPLDESGEMLLEVATSSVTIGDAIEMLASAATSSGATPADVEDLIAGLADTLRETVGRGVPSTVLRVRRQRGRLVCELEAPGAPGDPAEIFIVPEGRERGFGTWLAAIAFGGVRLGGGATGPTMQLDVLLPRTDARDRILTAAAELFHRRGIRATGVDAIIAHAGVAKATFYNYFPAKDDLVRAWLDTPGTDWFASVREAVESLEEPRKKLLAVFDELGAWLERDGFRGCPFVNSSIELVDPPPFVGEALARCLRSEAEFFGSTVNEAGLDPSLASAIHLLMQGAMLSAAATRSLAPVAHARAAAERLLGSYDFEAEPTRT